MSMFSVRKIFGGGAVGAVSHLAETSRKLPKFLGSSRKDI